MTGTCFFLNRVKAVRRAKEKRHIKSNTAKKQRERKRATSLALTIGQGNLFGTLSIDKELRFTL